MDFLVPTTRRAGAVNKRGISRPNSVIVKTEEEEDQDAPPPVPARGVAVSGNNVQNSPADAMSGGVKKVLPGGTSLTVLPQQTPPAVQNTNTINKVDSQQNNKDANGEL